jgi:hypothetical protein
MRMRPARLIDGNPDAKKARQRRPPLLSPQPPRRRRSALTSPQPSRGPPDIGRRATLHNRDGVIRFPHQPNISSSLWTFKDGANGGGPLDFPGRRNRSHLETISPRGRASSSPRPMSATEKPTGFNRRAQHLRLQCERRSLRFRRGIGIVEDTSNARDYDHHRPGGTLGDVARANLPEPTGSSSDPQGHVPSCRAGRMDFTELPRRNFLGLY